MKISVESDELAEEICSILNIEKCLKNKRARECVPNVVGYGILVLENYEMPGNTLVLAYYVMPLNQMTLNEYVYNTKYWLKLETVLDIGC